MAGRLTRVWEDGSRVVLNRERRITPTDELNSSGAHWERRIWKTAISSQTTNPDAVLRGHKEMSDIGLWCLSLDNSEAYQDFRYLELK